MKVSVKQMYSISDELNRLLFDVFGWTASNEEQEDEVDELAHHVAAGIRALITDEEEEDDS